MGRGRRGACSARAVFFIPSAESGVTIILLDL